MVDMTINDVVADFHNSINSICNQFKVVTDALKMTNNKMDALEKELIESGLEIKKLEDEIHSLMSKKTDL